MVGPVVRRVHRREGTFAMVWRTIPLIIVCIVSLAASPADRPKR
jgi:hypothetical protein